MVNFFFGSTRTDVEDWPSLRPARTSEPMMANAYSGGRLHKMVPVRTLLRTPSAIAIPILGTAAGQTHAMYAVVKTTELSTKR